MKTTLWNWNTTEAKRGQQRDVGIDTIKILLAFAAIVAIVVGAALGTIALAGVGFIGLLALIVPLLPNTRLNSRLRLKPHSRYIPQDVKIAVSARRRQVSYLWVYEGPPLRSHLPLLTRRQERRCK
jgi:hypothetical protein